MMKKWWQFWQQAPEGALRPEPNELQYEHPVDPNSPVELTEGMPLQEEHPVEWNPSVELTEKMLICPDGECIPLEEIRDIKAPRFIIGVDPALAAGDARLQETDGAMVVVTYGKAGPPLVKMIRVDSNDVADRLVSEAKKARKALHSGGGAKVTVGKCESCGRELRAKESALRPLMTLTCKCGHHSKLQVPIPQLEQF